MPPVRTNNKWLREVVVATLAARRCCRNRHPRVGCRASGADLTFATHSAAGSRSEYQIQSSTRVQYLLEVL
jgi:hypothetical protein